MRFCCLVLAVLVPLVVCAQARAGTYDVYSCRLPDGNPAPTGGWTPFATSGELGLVGTAADDCDRGGALTASLPAYALVGMDVGWTFASPPATTIEDFEIYRAAGPSSGEQGATRGYIAAVGAWPPADLMAGADEDCLAGLDPGVPWCYDGLGVPGLTLDAVNRYERRGLRASRLALGFGCWSLHGFEEPTCSVPNANPADLTIFAAKLTLRDDNAPIFETGDLGTQFARGVIRGVVRAAVTVSDQGAGLAEASLVVDGGEVDRRSIDNLPALCRRPFVDPAPCPSRRDLSLPFDSRTVADGVHVLRVAAYDAAGNRSLSAPVTVLVANAFGASPPVAGPNGDGATRFARLRAWLAGRSRRTDRTLAYGATTSVDGQLTTSDGVPIRSATLQIEQRDIGLSSLAKRVATVTTDGAGRFTYRVGRGASRSLRFSYMAFPGDAGPVASAQVRVHVRAGVSLRASPTHVHNGTVLTFTGRVLGQRGTGRAVVTIYALTPGPRPRIPVETFRAAASGRFTYRYRFRSIPGPVVYRFEARVLKQTGFPYAEGASRPVAVHGRP